LNISIKINTMIITKQTLDKKEMDFLQDHTVKETEAFVKGMNEALAIVDRALREERHHRNQIKNI